MRNKDPRYINETGFKGGTIATGAGLVVDFPIALGGAYIMSMNVNNSDSTDELVTVSMLNESDAVVAEFGAFTILSDAGNGTVETFNLKGAFTFLDKDGAENLILNIPKGYKLKFVGASGNCFVSIQYGTYASDL